MAAKATSDEQIIAALLNSGTIKQAAAAAGIAERTIYDRMSNGEFQALYKAAKADLIRGAVFSINNKLEAAIDTVNEIMANKENNPAVRLQAAQTIINTAAKFTDRLQESENIVQMQTEANSFKLPW